MQILEIVMNSPKVPACPKRDLEFMQILEIVMNSPKVPSCPPI